MSKTNTTWFHLYMESEQQQKENKWNKINEQQQQKPRSGLIDADRILISAK